MNIAFLNLYSGINNRGAEAFAHELGNRLQNNHEVVFFQGGKRTPEQAMQVIQIRGPVRQPESQATSGIFQKMIKLCLLDKASLTVLLFSLKALPKVIKGRFQVVVPMNGFWQLLFIRIFQPIGRYKILVTGHSGPGWDERWNLLLKPDLFIATTQPSVNWAQRVAPWTRVKLISYGMDMETFSHVQDAKIDLQKPLVLCPSALVPYKRVNLAIRAVAKLKNTSLLVLGKGPLEDKLNVLGERMLGSRFDLKSVSHEKIPSFYKAADVVTLPSSPQENSPMVFLESLAAGKQVVTTDTPRSRWMLEEAGIYCNPQNSDRYAQALKEALAKANKAGTTNRIKKARKKFSMDAILKTYEHVMQSLIQ